MSLKKSLMEQGMKLLADPRVMKLMQDERFVKAMMTAMSMPGKIDGFTKEQAEKFAKRMSLATADEVRDLKRTVRSLEDNGGACATPGARNPGPARADRARRAGRTTAPDECQARSAMKRASRGRALLAGWNSSASPLAHGAYP